MGNIRIIYQEHGYLPITIRGGDISPTLCTTSQKFHQWLLMEIEDNMEVENNKNSRGQKCLSCAIRTRHYCGKDKRIEMGTEVANSITTVQKDSMVSLAEDEQIKFDFCASNGKKDGNSKDELKKDAIKKKKIRIRRLTPSECLRLMGFDDADFFKAKEVNCDSNLYQQAGNSIVTDCIYHMLLPMVSGNESGVPCKHDWR